MLRLSQHEWSYLLGFLIELACLDAIRTELQPLLPGWQNDSHVVVLSNTKVFVGFLYEQMCGRQYCCVLFRPMSA